MAKSQADQDKEDLGKLEPKLTIQKKRNPEVFDWVKNLSRGKLTQFIYEVLDTYMENGLLLKDSWVHPTDEKALQLLNNPKSAAKSSADLEDIKQQLDDIQSQLALILSNVQNNGGAVNLTALLALMGQVSPLQNNAAIPRAEPATANYENKSNFDNQNIYRKDQVLSESTTKIPQQSVSLSNENNSENTISDDLVFTLDDNDSSHPTAQDDKAPPEVKALGSTGGFSFY